MATPRYPSLYQINTRVWLTELSRRLGRKKRASPHLCREPDELIDQELKQF